METGPDPSITSSSEPQVEVTDNFMNKGEVADNLEVEKVGVPILTEVKKDKETSEELDSLSDNKNYEKIEASSAVPDFDTELIGTKDQLKTITETYVFKNTKLAWKQVILNQINEVINQLLNHPRFRPNPGGPSSFYATLLRTSYALENKDPENIKPQKHNSNKPSTSQNKPSTVAVTSKYTPQPGQFGKLGKLINSQVFEFDQWDQYAEIKSQTFPGPLQELLSLRQLILTSEKLENISGVTLLDPFLSLLSSGESSGSIVSSSLSALDKFLTLELINPKTLHLPETLFHISEALVNCRFESGDVSSDEVVLTKLIQLMGAVLSDNRLIHYFTSTHVEAILRAAISVGCQLRLAAVSRYQTENVIRKTVTRVFQHLLGSCQPVLVSLLDIVISLIEPSSKQHSNYTRLLGLGILSDLLTSLGSEMFDEEALLPLLSGRLCRYLWLLQDGEHLAIVARSLDLTTTLIHIAQSRLKQQQQLWIQQCITRLVTLSTSPNHTGPYRQNRDDEMSFLFSNFLLQLIHKTPTFFNELFVNFDCVLNQPYASLDLIGFIVESSLRLSSSQDGSSRQSNIWMDQIIKILLGLFTRSQCKSDAGVLKQLTNFEALSSFQFDYSERNEGSHFEYCDRNPEELLEAQRHKKIILEAVNLFNQKPSRCIEYLIEFNILPAKDSPEFNSRLSHFFHHTLGLNKKVLGDFLSKKDNVPILEAFIAEFDFSGKRIDVAIREFLTSFRLPGESQLISRIFEEFSEIYFQTKPEHIDSKDAVYLLAYSLMMVNTDLHSQQVKNKMQFTSFQRMHRKNNDGKDFEESFLREIYDAIKHDEIILPEEQDGIVSREYNWKLFVDNPAFTGSYRYCHPGQYDREVFMMSANLLTDLFVQTYANSTTDTTLQISLQGLYLLVSLSDYYGISDATDYILRRMTMLTGTIFNPEETNDDIWSQQRTSVVNRTQQVDGTILSDLSCNLGQSYKSQLITIFLFNVAGDIPRSLFNSWWDILDMLKLFLDSFLLPPDLTELPNLSLKSTSLSAKSPIPFRPRIDAHLRSKKATTKYNQPDGSNSQVDDETNADENREIVTSESSSGLFSTFSSLLGYSNQHPTLLWDSSPQLLFAYLDSVRKMIPSCRFDKIISALIHLDNDNFEAVLKRIMILVKTQHSISEAPAPPAAATIPRPASESEKDRSSRKSGAPASHSRPTTPRSTAGSLNTQASKKASLYKPSTAFFLDWLVKSIIQRPNSEQQWSLVISFLGDVCYHAEFYHPYLVQQAVTELLMILFHFVKPDSQVFSQPPCLMILDLFSSLSPSVVSIACLPLLAGFKLLHETNPSILSQPPYWTTCLHILQIAISLEDNLIIQEVFPLLQRLTETVHFISLSHPDYLALVNLLTEFSSPDRFIRSSGDAVNPIVKRSVLAIQYIGALIPKVPLLASGNGTPERAQMSSLLESKVQGTSGLRSSYYLPPLISLSSLSSHRRQEIRLQAFHQLKKCLTMPNLISSQHPEAQDWQPIFEKVLFPLVEKVLEFKPLTHATDSNKETVDEARARVVSLISNIFLHFVSTSVLVATEGSDDSPCSVKAYTAFASLWLEVLDLFLRLLQISKEGAEQSEAVQESLKNILLVLTSTNLLNPPSSTSIGSSELSSLVIRTSTHSWALLDNAVPTLVSQLFPAPEAAKPVPEPTEAVATPEAAPPTSSTEAKSDEPDSQKPPAILEATPSDPVEPSAPVDSPSSSPAVSESLTYGNI